MESKGLGLPVVAPSSLPLVIAFWARERLAVRVGGTARSPCYIVALLNAPTDRMRDAAIARPLHPPKFPADIEGTFGPSVDKCRHTMRDLADLRMRVRRRPYGACHLPGYTSLLRG